MPTFRPEDLAQWVSRLWKNGTPEFPITGISHDTRTIKPGNLYVAIRGEHFDGHEFIREAFDKGAMAALVNERFQWLENPRALSNPRKNAILFFQSLENAKGAEACNVVDLSSRSEWEQSRRSGR